MPLATSQSDASLSVRPGEKYAAIALDAASRLQGPVNLGNGVFALPNANVVLPEHWTEWLGSIRADAIRTAPVLLLAKAASDAVGVLDHENVALQRRLDALYWCLLASGPLRVEGGVRFTGARGPGGIDVRQVSETRSVVSLQGLLHPPLTEPHLRRAAVMSLSLSELLAAPGMRRIKMAVRTFMLAFEEENIGERIHQFVRCIDGIVCARGREQFKERSKLFVGEQASSVCSELYLMRNNAEHFSDPAKGLDPLPLREDLVRAFRRAHEAEALARYCMCRLVETRAWSHLTDDDRVDEFWRISVEQRAAAWGPPLDLAAAVAQFNPAYVPDET
ncbi:hypothetical protein [Anaeromyxobacter terrae]|uniref:hypothetical protein n=1 Tax=Anaeromyxobacter terrae TaxID=2925406 RepID=UPI001F57D09A|nr:hypothetical protein [Anaeromyxobacter sp. SG22]